MIDLAWVTTALLGDPLVATLLVFSLGGALTHYMFRRYPLGRAMVRVLFLIVLTIVLLYAGVVPYEPLTRTGEPLQDAVRAALKIAWWLWTAWFLIGFLRVFVVTEHRPRETKLVQDLLAGSARVAKMHREGRRDQRGARLAGELGGKQSGGESGGEDRNAQAWP